MSHAKQPHSVASKYETDGIRAQLANGDAIFLKHLTKVLTPEANQYDPPDVPKFEYKSGAQFGKAMLQDFFQEQTSYLRALSVHEHGETRKQLRDAHAGAMKEIATMIFTNTYTVESLNPVLTEVQNTTSRSVTALNLNVTASNEVRDLTNTGLEAIMTELDKQGALIEKSFSNLIPTEGTDAAISLDKLRKDLNSDMRASEDRTKESIRTEANGIKINQKNLQKQTGPRNGTNNTGPTFTPPQTGAPTRPSWVPSASQPPPPETISIPRQKVKKNEETGEWEEEWVDATVKKRNPNPRFAFNDDIEANRKNERIYQNNKYRASKELMIYNVKTPPLPDQKGDMQHVIDISEEIRVVYLQSEGYDLQREDLTGAEVTRLWNYGKKDFKGPKPIKVTFKSPETVTRFLIGAEAAGFLGSRTLINKGKYQGAKDLKGIPKYYVRASTTMEERQIIADRIKKKEDNKKSAGYANWIAKKTQEREFKTKIGAEDLENWTLGPADFPHLPPVDGNNKETPAAGAAGTTGATGTAGTAGAPASTGTKRVAEGGTGGSPEHKVQKESQSPASTAASTPPPGGLKDIQQPLIVDEKDLIP